MKAMILAAGFGSRLQPFTNHTPKPLLPILGKPLLFYHLEKLYAAGFTDIVINVSHLSEKIVSLIGDGRRFNLNIIYSYEPYPLETAGGLRQALAFLGDKPFFCLNSDVWFDLPYDVFLHYYERLQLSDELAHLFLVDNPSHNIDGDFALDKNRVVLGAKSNLLNLTFSGVSILSSKLLNLNSEPKLGKLLKEAILNNNLIGGTYLPDSGWVDLGMYKNWMNLEKKLKRIQ
jgi:MurNAc alpha-1-phosphate uridylyltransferase